MKKSYNCKVLKYKDSTHVEIFSRTISREENIDDNKITDDIKKKNKIKIIEDLEEDLRKEEKKEHSSKVSVNRSKNNLYRIARSNEWEYFITFTFNPKTVDSTDYDVVSKIVTNWLNNLRKNSPDLKYLFVPEFHKDGKKYHYHGLIANADSLVLSDSGIVDKDGETIYNIDNWSWGYTTASKIKDNKRVINYIGKYITKELMNNLKYKKRYYASHNLNVVDEDLRLIYPDEKYKEYDFSAADYIKTIDVPGCGLTITYLEFNN